MTPLCVCLVSSLPCPKLRGIFVMITPLPVLLVPHIFFYSFALSFFFSFWSGGEVPLSTAIEVTEAVLTPGLLLFKPIQTKHILRGHDIRGGGDVFFFSSFLLSLTLYTSNIVPTESIQLKGQSYSFEISFSLVPPLLFPSATPSLSSFSLVSSLLHHTVHISTMKTK